MGIGKLRSSAILLVHSSYSDVLRAVHIQQASLFLMYTLRTELYQHARTKSCSPKLNITHFHLQNYSSRCNSSSITGSFRLEGTSGAVLSNTGLKAVDTEFRPGCLGLGPVGCWMPARTDYSQPPWDPVPKLNYPYQVVLKSIC